MHAWLEAQETATAKFKPSIGTRKATEYQLVIRDTDALFSCGSVNIEASRDQFAAWAKMILREVEPAALAAETEEA